MDKCIKIKGKFSRRNDVPSLIAEKIKLLDKASTSPAPEESAH
jgi:hypothetical protein